jgi:DNA replication initiation complex subunit (GINS family)
MVKVYSSSSLNFKNFKSMVNKATEQDLEKIKRLIASALSPREKTMYESLLHKAEEQIAKVRDSETVTKVEVAAEEIVAPSTEISKSTVKSDKSSSPSKEETVTEELPPENNEALPESGVNGAMFQALKD